MELTKELVPIGRFARLSGLTVKALRYYGEIGMLEPAWVDPETGYRWYSLAQARTAEAIRRLRRLELPLEEIRALLPASDDVVRERLLAHRSKLEGRAVEMKRIVAELQRLIDGEEELVPSAQPTRIKFELAIAEVPEQRVLAVVEHARADELATVVPRRIEEVKAYLEELGQTAVGSPFCVCPFPDSEGRLDAVIGWPVQDDLPGRGRIAPMTLAAVRALTLLHTGPYQELSRSYRLLAEAMERHGLTSVGPPRELYRTAPADVADPNEHEAMIVWPIGPEGELDTTKDVFFMRRVAD